MVVSMAFRDTDHLHLELGRVYISQQLESSSSLIHTRRLEAFHRSYTIS